MRKIKSLAPFLACLLLVGCAAGDDGFVEPMGDRRAELEKIISAVDWSKAEEWALVLDEFDFTPADLVFRRNQPYELTITNEGKTAHSFVAKSFFDAIAVQGLVFGDGEVKMPLLESIAFEAGESKTLVFAPISAGEFPLTCDQPLHEMFGMSGAIRIE